MLGSIFSVQDVLLVRAIKHGFRIEMSKPEEDEKGRTEENRRTEWGVRKKERDCQS